MHISEIILKKLLSNNFESVIEANKLLIGFAYANKKWPLTVIKKAVKTLAGRDNVKFYNLKSKESINPNIAVQELGKLIQDNRLLENIARTQQLIFDSKELMDEIEPYLFGSTDKNQNRIIFAILGVQLQIQTILKQDTYGNFCSYCGNYCERNHYCQSCGKIPGGELAKAILHAYMGVLTVGIMAVMPVILIINGDLDFSGDFIPYFIGFLTFLFIFWMGISWLKDAWSVFKEFSVIRKAYKKKIGLSS